jgi:hypothetical protein
VRILTNEGDRRKMSSVGEIYARPRLLYRAEVASSWTLAVLDIKASLRQLAG